MHRYRQHLDLRRADPRRQWTSGPQGDFVAPGVGYTERDLEAEGFVEGDGEVTLYIQGVRPGEGTIEFWLDVDGDDEGYVLADEVKYSAITVDLAVDSLNRFAFAAPLDQSTPSGRLQDQFEDHDANMWGKIIMANDNDDDRDGIPDFADGFNWDGIEGNDDDYPALGAPGQGNEAFVPITITLPDPIEMWKSRIQIEYSASDPAGVMRDAPSRAFDLFTFEAAPGALRLWTSNAGQRSMEPFYVEGGNYVPPRYSNDSDDSTDSGPYNPSFYSYDEFSQLPWSGSSVTLYLEMVRATSEPVTITIRVDPDGNGAARFMVADTIRVTGNSLQVLNASLLATGRLKVATWSNSYASNTGPLLNEFIDPDPDRFYVRLEAPQLAFQQKVPARISTQTAKSPFDWPHDDPPTVIQLTETGAGTGVFLSQSQMLVSDKVDDGGPLNNNGMPLSVNLLGKDDTDQKPTGGHGDRTHMVGLGGTVFVEWVAPHGYYYETTAAVPVQKVIDKLRFVVYLQPHKTGVAFRQQVRGKIIQAIRYANERFAQAGIYIDASASTIEFLAWPAVESEAIYYGIFGHGDISMGEVSVSEDEAFRRSGTPQTDDIVAFFVPQFFEIELLGYATAPVVYRSVPMTHINNVVFAYAPAVYSHNFVFAHEIGHLLYDRTHRSNDWELMRAGAGAGNPDRNVNWVRRIRPGGQHGYDDVANMQGSVLVVNPE